MGNLHELAPSDGVLLDFIRQRFEVVQSRELHDGLPLLAVQEGLHGVGPLLYLGVRGDQTSQEVPELFPGDSQALLLVLAQHLLGDEGDADLGASVALLVYEGPVVVLPLALGLRPLGARLMGAMHVLQHLDFLYFKAAVLLGVRVFVLLVELDGHVEGEHELVLLEERHAHVGVEHFEEVGLQLLDAALGVLHLVRAVGETEHKELFEPLHRELVHGV